MGFKIRLLFYILTLDCDLILIFFDIAAHAGNAIESNVVIANLQNYSLIIVRESIITKPDKKILLRFLAVSYRTPFSSSIRIPA
eukprot:UN23996